VLYRENTTKHKTSKDSFDLIATHAIEFILISVCCHHKIQAQKY